MKFTIGNLSPAAVIPPASDPYFQNVVLLVGFNGTNGQTTFTDDSAYTHALTRAGSAQVTVSNVKFGSGSGLFAGGSDAITSPYSTDWDFGSGDFTVEGWARFTSVGNCGFIGQYNGTSGGGGQFVFESNSLRWNQYGPSVGQIFETTNAWTPNPNQWYFLTAERFGTTYRLYRDGAMVCKVTGVTGAIGVISSPISIGPTFELSITGEMDEWRVTKGIARYASDAGCPVPTAAFPRVGPPWFLTGPTASGNTWVGQVLTLTETDNATSRAYQWKRNGSAISGATASTYTLVSGDIGATITCTITLTNAYGTTTATSNAVGPITATNPTAAVRGSRYLYVNNLATGTITLPTGSVAGDRIVVYAGHGYGITGIVPSGFTSLDNSAGSNYNGAVYTKVLTSGDITTGSVTVSFAGLYYGVVIAVTFVGGLTGVRVTTPLRDGSGAATRTVTTSGAPVAGDLVLYFGSARMNGAVTCNQGLTLQAGTPAAEGSGAAFFGTAAGGAITAIFSYSGSSSGDYQAIVVLQP